MSPSWKITPEEPEDAPDSSSGKRRWLPEKFGKFEFERPAPVKAADIKARHDARKAKKEKKKAAVSTRQKKVRRVRALWCTLGAGLVVTAFIGSQTTQTFEATNAANADRIADLTAQTEAGPETVEVVTSQDLLDLSDAARAKADDLVAAQNEFGVLAQKMNADITSGKGNGAPTKSYNAFIEHRKDLAGYFEAEAMTAADEDVYSFTTAPYLDADEIDPRLPWYVRYDGTKASDPDSYGWEVETVMPDTEEPDEATVVLVSRDSKDEPLAWAQMTYMKKTEKFTDLSLIITAAGGQHVDPGTKTDDDGVPEPVKTAKPKKDKEKKDK